MCVISTEGRDLLNYTDCLIELFDLSEYHVPGVVGCAMRTDAIMQVSSLNI
jgi:hypothetical protein